MRWTTRGSADPQCRILAPRKYASFKLAALEHGTLPVAERSGNGDMVAASGVYVRLLRDCE